MSEALATLSHEIRVPLSVLLGYLALLEETNLTEAQAEYVQRIRQGAENVATTVDPLLWDPDAHRAFEKIARKVCK